MGQFFEAKSILLFALTVLAVLNLIKCDPYTVFTCPKKGDAVLPDLPPAFSSDVRINFANKQKTVEFRHYKDVAGKRESLEIFAQGRHVKYIVHGEQHLLVTFFENDFASCDVTSSSTIQLSYTDSGPNEILQKMLDVTQRVEEFYVADSGVSTGVFIKKWEGCFRKPLVNVSLGFSDKGWDNSGTGTKNRQLPVIIEAQINDDGIVGVVDNFQATMPEDVYFQPPADVFCPGFREDKKPPEIPNYFSYDSELTLFMSRDDKSPLVDHRSVYFDYPGQIYRIDFHDATPDKEGATPDKEGAEDVTLAVKGNSVIHDFNSKIEYSFELPVRKCELSEDRYTDGVIEEKKTEDDPMITSKQYFALDAKQTSYNGQFMTRGLMADVYTAVVPHFDKTPGNNIYSWYFSSVKTQLVENDKLEKNVLLRVVSHPETGSNRSDRVEINFYNFEKDEPNAQEFDISNCYDETLSKLYVITFPANKDLRGSENFLKVAVHLALRKFTGVSKQRIFVSEVAFNKEFMFAEFKLLESPRALKAKAAIKELSLAEAAAKLKAGVSDGSFTLSVTHEKEVIKLIPLQNGFNEYSGDRKQADPNSYGQGSVIGLTIGMLLLGFVLGGIALNLVVSRKFGVSLFGKKSGMNNFNNPLNESPL